MKGAIGFGLLAIGAICVGAAVGEFLYAEHEQASLGNEWRSLPPAVPTAKQDLPAGVLARMAFDRLQKEVYVLDNKASSNLKRGPVWLGSKPNFGGEGNTVIAGHRDTHFRFLQDVRIGDVFTVDDVSGHSRYSVVSIAIVSPDDTARLAPARGKIVTLVTCYPFNTIGHASRRMVIRGEAVDDATFITSKY